MTDRPILFSGPMIRALLGGRKTQTRRVLNRARVFATPETPAFTLRGSDLARAMQNADRFRRLDGDGWFWEADAFDWQAPALRTGWMAHLGYAPGDRLWVREAWRTMAKLDHVAPRDLLSHATATNDITGAFYDAGGDMGVVVEGGRIVSRYLGWRSKKLDGSRYRAGMHMPRWASRLTLVVTEVRVERLQDISEADAVAEGPPAPPEGFHGTGYYDDFRESYADLWDDINAKRGFGWDTNPWVVAVSFDVVKSNIDSTGCAS